MSSAVWTNSLYLGCTKISFLLYDESFSPDQLPVCCLLSFICVLFVVLATVTIQRISQTVVSSSPVLKNKRKTFLCIFLNQQLLPGCDLRRNVYSVPVVIFLYPVLYPVFCILSILETGGIFLFAFPFLFVVVLVILLIFVEIFFPPGNGVFNFAC